MNKIRVILDVHLSYFRFLRDGYRNVMSFTPWKRVWWMFVLFILAILIPVFYIIGLTFTVVMLYSLIFDGGLDRILDNPPAEDWDIR